MPHDMTGRSSSLPKEASQEWDGRKEAEGIGSTKLPVCNGWMSGGQSGAGVLYTVERLVIARLIGSFLSAVNAHWNFQS